MSKSTKIIAALGVVAGLGVAALPAFTYAAQTPQSVDGNVELYVEVQPAIAMTITGNNDNSDHQAITSYQYAIVTNPTGDPSQSSYYERAADGTFALSEDTEVDSGKTYFTRSADTTGVDVFSPMSAGNGVVDGHAEAFKVGPSSSYASLLPNSKVEGDATNLFRSTITVYTNNNSGYTLNVIDSDATTALTHTNGTDNIQTGAGAVAAGTAKWNFDSTPGADSSYEAKTAQAMVATGETAIVINQTSTKTDNGSATIVDYNVSTSADQATGVYSDTIVYTATTNN